MKRPLLLLFISLAIANLQAQPIFEFRAVWITSVENIDWPNKGNFNVQNQKAEFIKILDGHKANGINTVIVQIRPAADAFYPSLLEPWSEYLTGKQGLPPTPYYDPLQFMIDETHKRGMEFHAWLNPYRAVFKISKSSIAPSHITRIHPNWFVRYNNQKIFNPGLPEVRNHVCRVVADLVERYKLDGIHMDDYFYPYPDSKGNDFADSKAYQAYNTNNLSKANWRRSNCDSIIKQLYQTITNINPNIKFGISPFGVWRNKSKDSLGSNTQAGISNYDDLYADILLWLQQGWIDYVVPQLYWERGHKLCDYDTLLQWWNNNTFGKHLYIGHGIYRAGTNAAWKNKNEIPNQIKKIREYSTTQGSVYFSSKTFDKNPNGWSDSLKNNYYAYPALPPPMPWIDSIAPEIPSVQFISNNTFGISYNGKQKIKCYAVFTVPENEIANYTNASLVKLILPHEKLEINAQKYFANNKKVFVATVSHTNNVSNWVQIKQ